MLWWFLAFLGLCFVGGLYLVLTKQITWGQFFFGMGTKESGRVSSARKTERFNTHATETGTKRFLPKIKSGFQIYEETKVAGVSLRKSHVIDFFEAENQDLVLEREPTNTHDNNAIKVFGVSSCGKALLGYVPKEIAARIVRTNSYSLIYPRLRSIYVADNGYVEVGFQILGPKSHKSHYSGPDAL